MQVFTAAQIKKAEKQGFENGVSYEKMMETAGINAAKIIDNQNKNELLKITVVCGKGKNGGDGFVAANWLFKNTKHKISLILALGEPKDEVSKKMLSKLDNSNAKIIKYAEEPQKSLECIKKSDIIIDAVFGIGIRGEVYGDAKTIIDSINSSKAKIYSLDIPSGLESDINFLPKTYIKADHTITMLKPKPAIVLKPTKGACGKVHIVKIGIDEDIISNIEPEFFTADKKYLKSLFSPRAYDSHKGSFGNVLNICGSFCMPGAAILAAKACVSCGAGLVRAAFPSVAYPAIASQLTEPILMPLKSNQNGRICNSEAESLIKEAEKSSLILIGCGLGIDEDIKDLVSQIIKNTNCPLIIDADGINALSFNINLLKEAKGDILLTPHPGEMSRLTGLSIKDINTNRLNVAKSFAKEWKVNLLLKGANSIIASPNGKCYVNATGSPALARGGSGDVLAGMIAAFIAQGISVFDAAVAAAYVHGAAAEKFAPAYLEIGLTPSRLIDKIPFALSALLDA